MASIFPGDGGCFGLGQVLLDLFGKGFLEFIPKKGTLG